MAQTQQTDNANNFPLRSGILQRKCDCGTKTSAEEECSACAGTQNNLQRKLSIGASNDPLEHEADRVADQVMSRSSNTAISNAPIKIQRASNNIENSSRGGSVPSSVNSVLASSGSAMESGLRQNMEQRFGHDFSQVRIHTGSSAAKSAHDVDAHAYTVGNDVVFGTGQYSPNTQSGQSLLAHELVHTVQQSSGVIRRQRRSNCNVTPRSSNDEVDVRCGESTYRVDVDVVNSREAQTEVTTNLGLNGTEISLTIEICRNGTVVNIRPSINLPEALRDVVGNVIGGSGALDGVTVTPELEINLIQSRRYSISLSGGPVVDVGSGEVVGGQGRLNIDTSVGRFGVGVDGNRDRIGGSITFTPGDSRPERRDCTRQVKKLVMRCRSVSVIPAVPAVDEVRNTLRREVYLLFPYARSTPIREVLTRTGNSRPTTAEASEVRALATEGYQVRSIEGFASPEGSRSTGRRFIGNIRLAENRASSAKDWLTANCPECGGLPIQAVGRSELYSPGEDPEVEGRALAQSATSQFIDGNDPFSPDTEEGREALRQSSLRTRRDAIYPQLRRARIVMDRSVLVSPAQPAIPSSELLRRASCPREVRDAVRNHYRILSII